MNYISTRNKGYSVSAAEAISRGLAPDGGLFVPETIPSISMDEIRNMGSMSYQERALVILEKYLSDFSEEELKDIISASYGSNFDHKDVTPLHFVDSSTACLELWHGPTCAFKDLALQMLPHLLTRSLKKCGETRDVCILVATSGDTGKAALDGFADVDGTKIIVFYPDDGVSNVQKLQMVTQAGGNVLVYAVKGNFDDAQTGVKKIFGDKAFADVLSERGYFLSSANSINWGRLLPQIVYYFSAYCDFVNSGNISWGDILDYAVPTGNFGDILAGWYAKKMGLPVGNLICCSNANNVLTDFLNTGRYNKNRPFYTTISPSMDILVSSNLERLLFTVSQNDELVSDLMKQLFSEGSYQVDDAIISSIREDFRSGCCDDTETKDMIRKSYQDEDYLIDTHTAVAFRVLEQYRTENANVPTVVLSTASPYKFCDSVLSALGKNVDNCLGAELINALNETTGVKAPEPLKDLDKREVRFTGVTEKEDMITVVDQFLA